MNSGTSSPAPASIDQVRRSLKVFDLLNQTWAKLDSQPGFVIRLSDGKVVSVKHFCDAIAHIQLFDSKGRKLNAGKEWLNSPSPRTVHKEIFLPHALGEFPASDFVELFEGKDCYNCWRGWSAVPASEPDNEALQAYYAVRDWLFDGQPEVRDWLEHWIAHKLLYPAIKQPNIPILIGFQGSGKDSLARFYVGLFGEHGDNIPGTAIKRQFNKFMAHRLFLNISELEDASPQFFKDLVSNKVELIEPKFVDARTGPSYLQLFATTNERTPYLLKVDDRRGGIFRVCKDKDAAAARIDTRLVGELENVIADPKNYAGIYPYFTALGLNGYNPFAEPYHTDDKDDLIRQHRTDAEQFIWEVLTHPDDFWVDVGGRPHRCDLASVQDFAKLPDAPPSMSRLPEDRRGLTTIGKWLAEIRHRGTVNDGNPVRTNAGLLRLWPVRNPDKWYRATPAEIAAHYNNEPEPGLRVVK